MRVMMLTWEYPPRSVGGLAEHVYHLSRELARTGIDVAVFTAGLPDSPAEAYEQGVSVYRTSGLPPHSHDFLSWVQGLNLDLFAAASRVALPVLCNRDWRHRFGKRRPVLIHAHDWLVMFAARALKHTFQLPLMATIHATEAGRHGGIHTAEQRFIHDAEWALTYEAWRVVCCSRFMAEQVGDQLTVPEDKIRVIPNGVDPSSLVPPKNDADLRRRFAGDHERILLFIGRLVPEKGVQILLSALPRILAVAPDVKVVVAGGGPYRDSLQRLALDLKVDHKVCFAGYVDDRTRRLLYAWSSAAVFPSLYEPFGIVALEGMSAGVPVIVSRTGGLAEVVSDGEDGLTITSGSAIDLAEAIVRVLNDNTIVDRLRTGGAQTVRRYSWAAAAAATGKLYAEVVEAADASAWRPGRCPGATVRDVRKEELTR